MGSLTRAERLHASLSWQNGRRTATRSFWEKFDCGTALAAAAVLGAVGWTVVAEDPSRPLATENSAAGASDGGLDDARARRAEIAEKVRYRGGESMFGAYGGSPYTYASDVTLRGPNVDMTVHGVDWEGRPFTSPIYYGIRIQRWLKQSAIGGMIDFTHSKVYSPMEQKTRYSGTRDGKPVPTEGKISDQFHKLEFTHGHNMLTANALWRLPLRGAFISPYVGVGLGISLPHSEVQLKGATGRTYEYQYTGPAAQVLVGVELRMPRLSYFGEYKLTYASYQVPLWNRDGAWVLQDLWTQFRRWLGGGQPDNGWAATKLLSHQGIAGMGVRSNP